MKELEKLAKVPYQDAIEKAIRIIAIPWALRTPEAADAKQREELVDFAKSRLNGLLKQALQISVAQMRQDIQRIQAQRREQEAAEKIAAIESMERYLDSLQAMAATELESGSQIGVYRSGSTRWALDYRPTSSMEQLANFARGDPDGRRRYCGLDNQCFYPYPED